MIGIISFLTACDTNIREENDEVVEKNSSLFTNELMDSEVGKYIEKIKSIELISQSITNSRSGIFEKPNKFTAYSYKIDLTLYDEVNFMQDFEIQKIIEDIQSFDDYSMVYSYSNELSEVLIQIGNDEYIGSSSQLLKNGEEFNPIYELEKQKIEAERNRKYDVTLYLHGKYYMLSNVTKSEILQKYNDEFIKAYHGTGHPDQPELEIAPPLDWKKDVEIRKVYE